MKKIILLSLLTVLIGLAAISCDAQPQSTAAPKTSTLSALDVIHARTSIRTYTDQIVSRDTLEMLVKAGMAAPSAMDKRPWQFVVVEDPEVLTALGKDLPTSRMAQKAPAAIIVCGDLEKAGDGWLEQYWIQDCSAVSQNILLAITELGLGGVWTSVYPAVDRMELVSGILGLPEHLIPFNIIPLGYPDQPYQPKDKWDADRIHWNKF